MKLKLKYLILRALILFQCISMHKSAQSKGQIRLLVSHGPQTSLSWVVDHNVQLLQLTLLLFALPHLICSKKTLKRPFKSLKTELCKSLHCAEKLMQSSKSSQRNDYFISVNSRDSQQLRKCESQSFEMPLHSLAPESQLSDQIVPTDCSLCCLDCSVGLI